jgi:hypothetical protein
VKALPVRDGSGPAPFTTGAQRLKNPAVTNKRDERAWNEHQYGDTGSPACVNPPLSKAEQPPRPPTWTIDYSSPTTRPYQFLTQCGNLTYCTFL